jgi:hypothetical protein
MHLIFLSDKSGNYVFRRWPIYKNIPKDTESNCAPTNLHFKSPMQRLGMVIHTSDPSTWEAGTEGL